MMALRLPITCVGMIEVALFYGCCSMVMLDLAVDSPSRLYVYISGGTGLRVHISVMPVDALLYYGARRGAELMYNPPTA